MPTEKKFPEPQAFEEGDCPHIAMTDVESSQVKCIGHCPVTNTLAVVFKHGPGHVYHYPEVSPEFHRAFMGAESKGKFFKENVRRLPFKKYRAAEKAPA